jgi:lantibiotic modifying enzyme
MAIEGTAPLEIALGLARHLAETAVWHQDRCTWLGMTQDAEDGSDQVDFTFGTLGPDLYGGTSGVALFLAECCRHDQALVETTLAALRQTFALAAATPGEERWGFYTGSVGVAWAAVQIGQRLRHPGLIDQGATVVGGLGAPPAELKVDLLGGAAGAIPALLALAELLKEPGLRERAIELGSLIISKADRSGDPWSWPVATGEIEAIRPLTGLAHGAAGIGYALLELGHATGRSEFIAAGHQAYRYENQWFRPQSNNWSDFRDHDGDQAPACVAWCHGAPGIALTRMRAVRLGYSEYQGDVDAAMATTTAQLADRDEWIEGDGSLCHGRAGLGEILRYGGDSESAALVHQAARSTVERYGANWSDWPCGVRRGSNPSLMLGLAGIGYAYLGLAEPEVPCVLLPGSVSSSR